MAVIEIEGEEMVWQNYANCLGVDPNLFFPERGASTREAKEVCRGCVVQDECLEFALSNGEKFGIWGGRSERERRRVRRQRALATRRRRWPGLVQLGTKWPGSGVSKQSRLSWPHVRFDFHPVRF